MCEQRGPGPGCDDDDRPARAKARASPIPRLAPALDQRVDPEAEADPGHGCPPISSSPTLSERISTSPARSLRTTASAIARRPIASAPIAAAASASGAMTVGAMARGPTTCGPMKRPPTAAASDRCRMRFVRFMTVPFRRFLCRSGPAATLGGCRALRRYPLVTPCRPSTGERRSALPPDWMAIAAHAAHTVAVAPGRASHRKWLDTGTGPVEGAAMQWWTRHADEP